MVVTRGSTVIVLLGLALGACSSTVTLKSPGGAAPPPSVSAEAPAEAPTEAGAAPAPAETPVPEARSAGGSAPADSAPAANAAATSPSASPAPAASGLATPAPPTVATGSRGASTPPRRAASIKDRFQSGLHTGTVGAAFGGLAGPIGLAAGGGGGFIAGFIAGRPLFGGRAPAQDPGSWETQVEDQQVWEDQVAAQVEALDGGTPAPATGIGENASADAANPVAVASAGEAGGDPVASYEAWSEQIMSHAPPASARTAAEREAPPAETDEEGDLRLQPFDANRDGRADAWFGYEGKTLREHAVDRDGDGRPDRVDFYEAGAVAQRKLDDDGDGRFERIENFEGGVMTGSLLDEDGDGLFEKSSPTSEAP